MMLAAGKDAPEEAQKLPGFVRRGSERPLGPQDIWGGEVHLDLGFAARPAGPSAAGEDTGETTDGQAGTWGTEPAAKETTDSPSDSQEDGKDR